MSDPIDKAEQAIAVVKGVMSAAAETPELAESGKNLAKTAKTLTTAINNVLLPIAAVNYAFGKGRNYFEKQFRKDLEKVTSSIPEENLEEPKASIAAPVLQGLTFSHEESSLKDMYLKLLASSMDNRSPEKAHPAFAEIIRQLSSFEASLLPLWLKLESHAPIAALGLRTDKQRTDYVEKHKHLINIRHSHDQKPAQIPSMSAYIANWVRLGLFEAEYSTQLTAPNSYDWVKERPEYKTLLEEASDEEMIHLGKGVLFRTAFGEKFCGAVM